MNIRTISQLPEFTGNFNTQQNKKTLIEVSEPVAQTNGKYISKKTTYERLLSCENIYINSVVKSQYGLYNNCGNELSNVVKQISNQTFTFNGNKTFSGNVLLTKNIPISCETTQLAANVGYVNNKIANSPIVIKGTSNVDAVLYLNDDSNYIDASQKTKYFVWHFDAGASQYCTNSVTVSEYNEDGVRNSGVLVCWGYMAAPSNVAAADCWVALEAKLAGNWVMVQLQPWIIGSKSQVLQYVGFTLPVSGPVELRIKAGFVPYYGTSGFGSSGLVFNIDGSNPNENSVNTFNGYIIK